MFNLKSITNPPRVFSRGFRITVQVLQYLV